MLGRVQVEHEAHETAHEPRAFSAKNDEPRSADLRTALEVDQTELDPQIPVRLETGFAPRRSPASDDAVVLFTALGNVRQRDIGEFEHRILKIAFDRSELRLELCDFFAEGSRLKQEILRVFPAALFPRDILADSVAGGLSFFQRLYEGAALRVQLLRAIDYGRKRVELAAAAHAVAKHFDLLANHAQVMHVLLGWNSGLEGSEAAVRIEDCLNHDRSCCRCNRIDQQLRIDVRREIELARIAGAVALRLEDYNVSLLRDDERIGVGASRRLQDRVIGAAHLSQSHTTRCRHRADDLLHRIKDRVPGVIDVDCDVEISRAVHANGRAEIGVDSAWVSRGSAGEREHRIYVFDGRRRRP